MSGYCVMLLNYLDEADADTSSSSAAEDRRLTRYSQLRYVTLRSNHVNRRCISGEAAFLLGPSDFPSKLVFSASRLPGVGWNSCLHAGCKHASKRSEVC